MRSALHEFLHIADPGERLRNHAFFLRGQPRRAGYLLHVIAIGLWRGHTARRSMRLLQVAGFRQICHDIANARRAQPFAIGPG